MRRSKKRPRLIRGLSGTKKPSEAKIKLDKCGFGAHWATHARRSWSIARGWVILFSRGEMAILWESQNCGFPARLKTELWDMGADHLTCLGLFLRFCCARWLFADLYLHSWGSLLYLYIFLTRHSSFGLALFQLIFRSVFSLYFFMHNKHENIFKIKFDFRNLNDLKKIYIYISRWVSRPYITRWAVTQLQVENFGIAVSQSKNCAAWEKQARAPVLCIFCALAQNFLRTAVWKSKTNAARLVTRVIYFAHM